MKQLFYRSGSFLIVSALIIVLVIFLTLRTVNNKIDYKLGDQIEYAVFGHSHSESSLNDSLINNLKNLSSSAESYFYTYLKVKKILSNNHQIHTIFVEFTNNNIDKKMDEWTWGEEYLMARSPIYFPMMSKKDFEYIYSKNSNVFFSALSKSVRYNLIRILRSNYKLSKEFGGYKYLDDNKIGSKYINNHKLKKDFKELSFDNISYLKKIISYCKLKKVNIFLFRSPQHKDYNFLNNEKIFKKIKNMEFRSIDFLDFNKFPLKNTDFSDYAHLNYKGAFQFSIFFNSLIKEGLLQKKDKQEFIDYKILILNRESNIN